MNLIHLQKKPLLWARKISQEQKEGWKYVVEGIGMKNNSYKAWKLLRKLNSEKVKQHKHINVKPNEIARQF